MLASFVGPIPWLIVAEMFDSKYVSTAMSVTCQLNWTCNFFVGLFFPYMNDSLGPYSFGPFAIVLLLTFLYAWIYLPGKSAFVLFHDMNSCVQYKVSTTGCFI